MILTATPLRVSLFGGGTDYPAWFNEQPGAVLGMAIDKYCYVGVKRMPPGQLTDGDKGMRYRVQYSKVEDCQTVDEVRHPAVRGVLQHFQITDPLEFHCFSDLPGRSGLGGSSAFTVGLIHALRRLLNLGGGELLDPWLLATEATFLEQEVIREAVGCQDQVFAAHGGLLYITFSREGRTLRTLRLPAERLQELESSLILVYSGTMRDAHLMAAKQIAAIPGKHLELARMKALADYGMEVLLNHKPLVEVGRMLNEAWHLKRSLCSEVTTNDVDALYKRGLELGALGGKLLGAGGGGYLLFFVPHEVQAGFLAGIGAPCVRFRIAHAGTRVVIEEER